MHISTLCVVLSYRRSDRVKRRERMKTPLLFFMVLLVVPESPFHKAQALNSFVI